MIRFRLHLADGGVELTQGFRNVWLWCIYAPPRRREKAPQEPLERRNQSQHHRRSIKNAVAAFCGGFAPTTEATGDRNQTYEIDAIVNAKQISPAPGKALSKRSKLGTILGQWDSRTVVNCPK
jgi:hypothetical protein